MGSASPVHAPPLGDTALFTPVAVGPWALRHRVVQAPLTRMRNELRDDAGAGAVYVPGDRVVRYYAERATPGGLQITEATDICAGASGYPGAPGVFCAAQAAGWRRVTDAVHARGGVVVCQLWHTGRASSSAMRGGARPVSAAAAPLAGAYLDGTPCAADPPRALDAGELPGLAAAWAAAAARAVGDAGFDGVEVHGANGYLLDQFLHDNVNARADAYGGSAANRARLLLEVLAAVAEAVGPDRVGVRLSPYNYFQDTRDSDPNRHWAVVCERIAALPAAHRPAYVHMVEPRFDEVLDEQQKMAALAEYTASDGGEGTGETPLTKNSLTPFRNILKAAGVKFLAAGGFDRENAAPKVDGDGADLVVFGRSFIANPDLVERLRNGWELNAYDRATFYGADPPEKGYIDYPTYSKGNGESGDVE